MRAGRPRSQGNHSPLEGESQKAGRRRLMRWGVGAGRLLRKPTCTLWENSRLPASRAPAPGPGGSSESETGFVSGQSPPTPWLADHSRVKQPVLIPIGSRGHVSLIRLAASLNIDTQEKQDEKLVHKKLIGSIIECAFVENLSVLRGPSRTPFESFPIPWNPFADSSFALLNRSFVALGGNLFLPSPNLWRIPLEFSPSP